MTPHKNFFPAPRPPLAIAPLQVFTPHAAGIDIGATAHWVAVPPDRAPQPVRRFGTCTTALDDLADWLLDCGIPSVAMASTGVYWIPLCERLESPGLQVIRIDPRQATRAPGRPKTDVLDCQWRQRLHAYGLLAGAFRPDDQVCVLRGDLRHRHLLLTDAARPIQHRQKALEQRNITLPEAVRDLTGVTGMAILKAIVAGERAPRKLATLRDSRGKQDATQSARALQGHWRHEPLCALKQA